MTPDDREAMANGAGLLAGQPVDDVHVRIDNSEILVTGAHVNKGYLDPARDAETKLRDGDVVWHRTGDAGRLDDNGRLWLLGRHGADVGGLHPFVVEAAARLWPGVVRTALAEMNGTPVLAIEGDESTGRHGRKRLPLCSGSPTSVIWRLSRWTDATIRKWITQRCAKRWAKPIPPDQD